MQNQFDRRKLRLLCKPIPGGLSFPDIGSPGFEVRPGEKIREYHFMLDQTTFNELAGVIRQGLGIQAASVPDLVAIILKWAYSILEVKHFSEPERETVYKFIDANPGEERKSVKVTIPKRLYNRIKLLHKDLDAYSMAQIVRDVIHRFLALLEKWRQGLRDFLRLFDFCWGKVKEKFRKEKRSIRVVKPPVWGKSLFRTTYTDQFSPLEIFLC